MRAFVTGATGFVGAHIVRALLDRGDEVRCLVREGSPRTNVDGLPVDLFVGDLRDKDSLVRAVEDADTVFHCAADYRLFVPSPEAMYDSNVEGTRNLLEACADRGTRRIVYTSTVGALGLRDHGEVANESTPVTVDQMVGHYKKSKFLAERVAEEWAERGLHVVIVNPSAPVGERDVKPTATGKMIVDHLRGRMSAYVDTGLNLVDVRDVAAGHLLAAERGRPGEKYVLGNRNMTLKEILVTLSKITGIPAPRVRLPHFVPLAVSMVDTFLARRLGREPRVALDAVKLARHKMFFDSTKAVRELGLPQTPVELPLERAVHWFRSNGYADRGAGRKKWAA